MARILLIDDDSQVRSVLAGFLSHDGHQVDMAKNGHDARRFLQENLYDLILTDIVMPDQDGFEVIMSQAPNPERPRIIAISGGSPALSQQMLLSIAARMPVERILAKPISYEDLATAVREVLAAPLKTVAQKTA